VLDCSLLESGGGVRSGEALRQRPQPVSQWLRECRLPAPGIRLSGDVECLNGPSGPD
jgi:hypothetical protein